MDTKEIQQQQQPTNKWKKRIERKKSVLYA